MDDWEIIAGIVLAILASIIVCCCCFLCNNDKKKNKIHYLDVEKGVTKHPLKPVVPLDSSDEDSESTDGGGYSKRHNYTHSDNENEVVKRASEENGTLLWANRRQVFINHPGSTHAEIMLITSDVNLKSITTIHIKNSPCHDCSKALRNHFRTISPKPTILVGRIWHLDDEDDKKGLQQLLREGFKIGVWERLHRTMYGHDTKTINYIRQLK